MFTVSIILVVTLIILVCVVNFVLTNIQMFQAPFDIVISLPLTGWSHTWEGVNFMYIIAASILLGALIIGLSTWVLDAKRKLKLRNMRKELNRLEKALQEAKVSLPHENASELDDFTEEGNINSSESASPTPDQIAKSFEDAVHSEDYVEQSAEHADERFSQNGQHRQESVPANATQQRLTHETPIEAEVVDAVESSSDENEAGAKHKDERNE